MWQTVWLLLLAVLACMDYSSAASKAPDCLLVRGSVQCVPNSSKAKNVLVELVDDNWVSDEIVDKAFTSTSGYFQLQGCAKDGKFTKEVRLINDCGSQTQTWINKIPANVTGTEFYMGMINLSDDPHFPTKTRKAYKKTPPEPCQKPRRRQRSAGYSARDVLDMLAMP